jgi:hypothetical protein
MLRGLPLYEGNIPQVENRGVGKSFSVKFSTLLWKERSHGYHTSLWFLACPLIDDMAGDGGNTPGGGQEPVGINVLLLDKQTGETLKFTGTVYLVNRVTFDANESVQLSTQVNRHDLQGVSLTAGTTYTASTPVRVNENHYGIAGYYQTYKAGVNFTGNETASQYRMCASLHVTVRPDGTTTSYFYTIKFARRSQQA